MIECDQCHRHHRASEEACPFCATRRPVGSIALNVVAAAVASFVLAACYGGTPTDKTPTGTTGDTGSPTTGTTP